MGIGGAAFVLGGMVLLGLISVLVGLVGLIVATTAERRKSWLVPNEIYAVGFGLLLASGLGTVNVFIIPPLGLLAAMCQLALLVWLMVLIVSSGAASAVDPERRLSGRVRQVASFAGIIIAIGLVVAIARSQTPLRAGAAVVWAYALPVMVLTVLALARSQQYRRPTLRALCACIAPGLLAIVIAIPLAVDPNQVVSLDLSGRPTGADGGRRLERMVARGNGITSDRIDSPEIKLKLPNGRRMEQDISGFSVNAYDGKIERAVWSIDLSDAERDEEQVAKLLDRYALDTTDVEVWRQCASAAQDDPGTAGLQFGWDLAYTSVTRFEESDLLLKASYYGAEESGRGGSVSFKAYWGSEDDYKRLGYDQSDAGFTCKRRT